MNRIDKLFSTRKDRILSIYFTAGYPGLHDTVKIIRELDRAGADMIEIGMPFSDPVADGPVIQKSSETALNNGMTLDLLFNQLEKIREITDLPLILMGYINPFFRYGIEKFVRKCSETGIDGTIIPDLPVDEYLNNYSGLFKDAALHNIFLVSPQTPYERMKYLDEETGGFLYLVSTSSTTGNNSGAGSSRNEYFSRLKKTGLQSPSLIGFGISDRASFDQACTAANGAIIGSAFIKALDSEGSLEDRIHRFISSVK
jgi:tryptophan synthase alpha chain